MAALELVGYAALAAAGAGLLVKGARMERRNNDADRLSWVRERTDALTGLWNDRMLIETLEWALDLDVPFTLVMLDIDSFTHTAELFGRDDSDHVLQTVASRLTAAVGEDFLIVRWDADEFCVVITETDPDAIIALVQEWRQDVAQPLEQSGHWTYPWTSVGAIVAEPGYTVDDMILGAVAAQQYALQKERCVVVWSPELANDESAAVDLAPDGDDLDLLYDQGVGAELVDDIDQPLDIWAGALA